MKHCIRCGFPYPPPPRIEKRGVPIEPLVFTLLIAAFTFGLVIGAGIGH